MGLHLLARLNSREIHLSPWPPEPPRRRVVHAGGSLGGLERPEPEACRTGAYLCLVHVEGTGPDTALAGAFPGARRYGGCREEGDGGEERGARDDEECRRGSGAEKSAGSGGGGAEKAAKNSGWRALMRCFNRACNITDQKCPTRTQFFYHAELSGES